MRALWLLFLASRPLSWVNTAFPFAAGYIVVSGRVDPSLIMGALYFLIPYNLLMYGLNDVFDYESDLRNPRKGGVEGAVLDRQHHKLIILAALSSNVPFICALLITGNALSTWVLLSLLFFVIAYSVPVLRFKERPLLDSISSSIHFVGPLMYGLAVVGWQFAYWPFIVAFFLWGMASHAFGATQDIVPDRAARITSIATVLGARWTIWFAVALYALSAALLFAQGGEASIVAFAGLFYIANIVQFASLRDESSHQAHTGWRRFIWLNMLTGFLVTAVLIVA